MSSWLIIGITQYNTGKNVNEITKKKVCGTSELKADLIIQRFALLCAPHPFGKKKNCYSIVNCSSSHHHHQNLFPFFLFWENLWLGNKRIRYATQKNKNKKKKKNFNKKKKKNLYYFLLCNIVYSYNIDTLLYSFGHILC